MSVYDPEFIEIYNPTLQPVSLKDYYITDVTFNNGGYYLLPQRGKVKGGDHHDFIARFPPDAVIQPSECQTIALGSYQSFLRRLNISPTYVLVRDDSTPPTVREMLTCFTGIINPEPGYTTLSNDGESVILFFWDGRGDIVKDVDYVVWGDKEEAICKTGKVCEGPDADLMPSTIILIYLCYNNT